MCLFLIRPSPRRFARGLGPGPRNGCCPDQWLLLRSSLLKLSGFSHCAIPRTFIQLHFFGNDINELRQSQLNEFASWLRWVLDLAVGVTKMHMWLKRYWHFVCAMGPPTLQPHGPGQLDLLYQIAAAGRSETNACRNLHSLIHKRGLTLPLKIHTVEVPVRKRKPKVRKTWVHYPVILPSTWAKYLLESHSFLLLGGHDINHGTWQRELAMFWETYLKTDPMVKPGAPPPERTVPLYIHGDEGRGKYRLPIMIQAIQAVVSFKGPAFKNSSGQLISKSVLPKFAYLHVELCWLPRVGCPK